MQQRDVAIGSNALIDCHRFKRRRRVTHGAAALHPVLAGCRSYRPRRRFVLANPVFRHLQQLQIFNLTAQLLYPPSERSERGIYCDTLIPSFRLSLPSPLSI